MDRYTEIYQPLREQAMELQNHYHDFNGGKFETPQATALNHQIKQLVSDIDLKKDPIVLHDRIKTIQTQLMQAQHIPHPTMNYEHYDFLHDNFENMRQRVKRIDQQF